MSKNNYYEYLLELNTSELIKECVKNHDAVINLQSIKEQYEKTLQELNYKIENIQIVDKMFDRKAATYQTTLTPPTYSFAFKSEKDYIQKIIAKALAYGDCNEHIEKNSVMMCGRKVLILE